MEFPKKLKLVLHESMVEKVSEDGTVTGNSFGYFITKMFCDYKKISCQYYTNSQLEENGILTDLVASDVVITEGHGNSFSDPYTFTGGCFATKKPGYAPNTFAAVRPFSREVWLGLFMSVIAVSVVNYIFYRVRFSLTGSLSDTFGNLLAENQPAWRSFAERIVEMFWNIGAAFLILCYGSVLLSFMTVPPREKGITTLEELIRGIKEGTAEAATVHQEGRMLLESEDEDIRFLGRYLMKHEKIAPINFTKTVTENFAVYTSKSLLDIVLSGGRHYISEDYVQTVYFVIYSTLSPHGGSFCCMNELNKFIHRLQQAGIIENIRKNEIRRVQMYYRFKSEGRDQYFQEEESARPLTLSDLSGSFFILIVGNSLATMCFVCEVIYHRWIGKASSENRQRGPTKAGNVLRKRKSMKTLNSHPERRISRF